MITSRRASEDLDKIRLAHQDIMQNMAVHTANVNNSNAQKAAEMANQQAVRAEVDKAKAVADSEVQKVAMQNDLKREELSIKRAALSAV